MFCWNLENQIILLTTKRTKIHACNCNKTPKHNSQFSCVLKSSIEYIRLHDVLVNFEVSCIFVNWFKNVGHRIYCKYCAGYWFLKSLMKVYDEMCPQRQIWVQMNINSSKADSKFGFAEFQILNMDNHRTESTIHVLRCRKNVEHAKHLY